MFLRVLGFWGNTSGKEEINWTGPSTLLPASTRAIPGLSLLQMGADTRSCLEKKLTGLLLKERDGQKEIERRTQKERKKKERRKRQRRRKGEDEE